MVAAQGSRFGADNARMGVRVVFVGLGVIGLALYGAFAVHHAGFGLQRVEYHASHEVCDRYHKVYGNTYICVLSRHDPPDVTAFQGSSRANWQDPAALMLALIGVASGVAAMVKLRPAASPT